MRTKAQKTTPNTKLRIAIIQSGLKGYVIARKAKLTPDQLSQIAHGRRQASEDQQKNIAKALGRDRADLFQAPPEALAS